MIIVTLAVSIFFVSAHLSALAEPPSYNSGPNLLVTSVMVLILFILASFTTLTTSIDKDYLWVKFGFGIFRKKFVLNEIVSATKVKNHWYFGWGIRFWPWPKMWIYNISGFDAVEIITKNGKIYRIGTDDRNGLESAIRQAMKLK